MISPLNLHAVPHFFDSFLTDPLRACMCFCGSLCVQVFSLPIRKANGRRRARKTRLRVERKRRRARKTRLRVERNRRCGGPTDPKFPPRSAHTDGVSSDAIVILHPHKRFWRRRSDCNSCSRCGWIPIGRESPCRRSSGGRRSCKRPFPRSPLSLYRWSDRFLHA